MVAMNRQRLTAIRCNEQESDVRRLLASSLLLQADDKPRSSVHVAADLGWTLRRTETAAIAAEEHGWLTLSTKRRV